MQIREVTVRSKRTSSSISATFSVIHWYFLSLKSREGMHVRHWDRLAKTSTTIVVIVQSIWLTPVGMAKCQLTHLTRWDRFSVCIVVTVSCVRPMQYGQTTTAAVAHVPTHPGGDEEFPRPPCKTEYLTSASSIFDATWTGCTNSTEHRCQRLETRSSHKSTQLRFYWRRP